MGRAMGDINRDRVERYVLADLSMTKVAARLSRPHPSQLTVGFMEVQLDVVHTSVSASITLMLCGWYK
jgi:hypothetical protein